MVERIRKAQKDKSTAKKAAYSLLVLAFGICLGLGSKILDETAFNELPSLFQMLDITNFLGRPAVWIFISVCIAVYSSSAGRAALNVFLFLAGMVACYYVYSALATGFFPGSYAMIWFGIAAVSPLPASICWYAKGEGRIAVILSGIIIGVLLAQAVFLFQGIRITHLPEVAVWLASLWVLRRKLKEFAAAAGIAVITAAVWQIVIPYWG